MNNIGPIRFKPYFKPVLWGGSRIAAFKGMEPNDEPVGESWEISGLEGFVSVVAEGPYAGETVESLLQKYGNDILGRNNYRIYGNKFPLLIKFIDASKDLSIQVHPDDELAQKIRVIANHGMEVRYHHDVVGVNSRLDSIQAAVLLANGEIICGSNQENAAYPSGICAERCAVFYANSRYPDSAVVALAIAASNKPGEFLSTPITPCGACRQVLLETQRRFNTPMRILLYGTSQVLAFDSINTLLPFQFTGKDMK